jgi:hypothetical protein
MVEEERERDRKKFASNQQLGKRCFDKHKVGDKNFELEHLDIK